MRNKMLHSLNRLFSRTLSCHGKAKASFALLVWLIESVDYV